jgi:hypothetical protein
MDQSITNLGKVSNYFSLATYHYKNKRQLFANVLIPQVFLVNKQWKMMRQVSNLRSLRGQFTQPNQPVHPLVGARFKIKPNEINMLAP